MEKNKEMFELDYDAIKANRKTLKDHIKACHEVQGDMVTCEEKKEIMEEGIPTNLFRL